MTAPSPAAWLVRWHDTHAVVWADSIEAARLEARKEAGPHTPVSARLATRAEVEAAGREVA